MCSICNIKQLPVLIIGMLLLWAVPMAGFAAADDSLESHLLAYDVDGEEISIEDVPENSYDGFVYVLKDDVSAVDRAEMEAKIEQIGDADVADEVFKDKIYSAESLDVIENLVDPDSIVCIEPNYIDYLDESESIVSETPDTALPESIESGTDSLMSYTSNDTYFSTNAWAYSLIRVQDVWARGVRGAGATRADTPTVAILDSGLIGASTAANRHEDIDYTHVKKALKSSRFRSCEDEHGHGTFIAGEIAAIMNNGKGVTGLMPDVNLIPYKVFDKDGGATIISEIAALNDLAYKYDVDVVNMSFGSVNKSKAFQSACTAAAKRGLILVAAAGNDGAQIYNYPASYHKVISVASIGKSGSYSEFSNYNDAVDVTAPGEELKGLYPTSPSAYNYREGTSMSTPMVSALAAMAKSYDSTIDHNKFMDILRRTCTDIGYTGYDYDYGYGIANFETAYQYITGELSKSDLPAMAKLPNNMKVKAHDKYFPASTVAAKAKTYKAIKVKKANGKVTYKVKFSNAKSRSALKFRKGRLTVSKGSPDGTYRLKVTVKAAGDENHKAKKMTKKVTVLIQ